MIVSLCVQFQQSSRVPSLGAPLVACSSSRQAALEADPYLLADSLKNDPFTSFPYETIGAEISPQNKPESNFGRKIPLPKINFSPHKETITPVPLSGGGLLPTNVSCTPARPNAVRVHWYVCSINAKTVNHHEHKTYPSKKTFKVQKRWVTMRAVAQVNPTAQNTLRLQNGFTLFIV
jgi:hypothetical protein